MRESAMLPWLPGQRLVLTTAMFLLSAAAVWAAAPAKPKPAEKAVDADHSTKMARGLEIFKKHVRPVLVQQCVKCHSGEAPESGLDLTTRERLLKGGDTGPAVLPGDSRNSLLYKLITYTKKPHMPKKAPKLPDAVIAQIAAWIDHGAPYDTSLIADKSEKPSWTQRVVAADARQFWSFQPLRRVEPPRVKNETWCRGAIDRFILAKLEDAGLQSSPQVSKHQLIRRAYFDLLGLPPTPEEIQKFVHDSAPDAYERTIGRLLESQHYGERWARHWLDLARFAESHGFEHDSDRPSAYHYRDFVIKALNDDLPFNTFVQWQLAGDEYAPDNNLALTATGFLAAGVHSTQITKNEVEKHRYDEMDDMLATTGTSMLGLTFGCARCHDHKYDPIPQADYYRMLSTFTTTVRSEIDINLDPEGYKKAKAAFGREHEPFLAALKKYEKEQLASRKAKLEKEWTANPQRHQWAEIDLLGRTGLRVAGLVQWVRTGDPEWRKLHQAAEDYAKKAPQPQLAKAMISTEGLQPVRLHSQGDDFFKETYFLRRGDPEQKEGVAAPGFLQVLMTSPTKEKTWETPPPKAWRTSYRRRAFAEWITDTKQGAGQLLARVIVNRLWQHHMGRGIVATPSDYGVRGERPTHPELLDWMATELIRNGWRLKPIHKLIVTSATYAQSSRPDEAKARVDNDNRLFWRRPPHRLEAEVIRDALLAVSGELDPKMFGPGTLDPNTKRRSIYFTVKRSKLIPMMTVFDAPEALGGVAQRPTSTVAPQALLLMNNPNVRHSAKSFARRIAPNVKTPLEDAIQTAYLIALTRPPSMEELADATAFVKQQTESYAADRKKDGRELALADFCQTLMCLNEFVYVE